MFTEKSVTEIVTIDEEINVVGMALQKSGLPISFDSLGKMWELYGAKYRGNKLENSVKPEIEFAVCLNKVPDYIAGCGVIEIGTIPDDCASFVIPKGKYIKDLFNAESFEKLTGEAMEKRNVKGWAKKNKVKINRTFTIEVYPNEEFAKGNFEMYSLTPISE